MAEVQLDDKRVSVFGGPVLDEDDPEYRGVQLPLEYWKTIIYLVAGVLRARSFLLTQDLSGIEVSPLDEFETYELSLDELELRTGLGFDGPLRDAELARGDAVPREPRKLRGLGDVEW